MRKDDDPALIGVPPRSGRIAGAWSRFDREAYALRATGMLFGSVRFHRHDVREHGEQTRICRRNDPDLC
jgi:hypothetical protein